jgi:hypothetical protein
MRKRSLKKYDAAFKARVAVAALTQPLSVLCSKKWERRESNPQRYSVESASRASAGRISRL